MQYNLYALDTLLDKHISFVGMYAVALQDLTLFGKKWHLEKQFSWNAVPT